MVTHTGILMVGCIRVLSFRPETFLAMRLLLLSLGKSCNLVHPVLLVLVRLRDPILLTVGIFVMLHCQRLG
jgi:hypothetical protein